MIVIKVGGNALAKQSDLSWIQVITELSLAGEKFVLVHGGGPQIDSELELHGVDRRFVDGLRYTDEATYRVVEMVLAGSVQQELVRTLKSFGLPAVGISGNDGGLITASKRDSMTGKDLGFVGNAKDVDPRVIVTLVEAGFMPVISSVSSDANGVGYNINADLAAGAIAAALGAKRMIFMTDVAGIYRDFPDEESLISKISLAELIAIKASFTAGMIPKVEAVIEAVSAGAREASVIDGRNGEALAALLAGKNVGTLVTHD